MAAAYTLYNMTVAEAIARLPIANVVLSSLDLAFSLFVFVALTGLVIATIIGRIVKSLRAAAKDLENSQSNLSRSQSVVHQIRRTRKSASAAAAQSRRRQPIIVSVFLALILILSLYQIPMSIIAVLYQLIGAASLGLSEASYFLRVFYFQMYVFLGSIFFTIFLRASIAFDYVSSKGTSQNNASRVRTRKIIRRVAYVLSLIASVVVVPVSLAAPIISTLQEYGLIDFVLYRSLLLGVVVPGVAVVVLSLAVAVLIPAGLLLVALHRSNAILRTASQMMQRHSSKKQKIAKLNAHSKRVQEQRIAMVKMSLAVLSFLCCSALLVVGIVLSAAFEKTTPIVGIISDMLFLRVVPSAGIAMSCLFLVWPFDTVKHVVRCFARNNARLKSLASAQIEVNDMIEDRAHSESDDLFSATDSVDTVGGVLAKANAASAGGADSVVGTPRVEMVSLPASPISASTPILTNPLLQDIQKEAKAEEEQMSSSAMSISTIGEQDTHSGVAISISTDTPRESDAELSSTSKIDITIS